MRFKKLAAVITTACLVGMGVIGLAPSATAGGYHYPPPPEVCTEWVPDTFHDVPNPNYIPGIPAVPGTPAVGEPNITVTGPWFNWSPNDSTGPQDYEPGWPTDDRGTWQGPHTDGGPIPEAEGTYQTGGGNSPYFHRGAGVVVPNPNYVPGTPGTPAVPAVGTPTISVVDVPGHEVEVECPDEEPRGVTPSTPIPNDACGTEDDFLNQPADTDDITYWTEGNGDIIATLVDQSGAVVFADTWGWTFDDETETLIRFHFAPADEDGSVFTDTPCEDPVCADGYDLCPDPVAVVFDIEADDPTCEDPGFLDTSVFPIEREGYTLTVFPTEFVGPGDYVITATANEDYVFEGEGDPTVRTATITVGERLEEGCTPPPCVDGLQPVWYVWTGGPTEGTPAADAEGWHATSGNPQSDNHSVPPRVYGEPYFVSHGGSGRGDYFKWELVDSDDCEVEPIPATPYIDILCSETEPGAAEWYDSITEGIEYHYDGEQFYTATALDGYVLTVPEGWILNEDGTVSFDTTAWMIENCTVPPCEVECEPFPTPIPFASPVPAPTCTADATFDAADLGGTVVEEAEGFVALDFPNVTAEVYTEGNSVLIDLFAKDGYVIEATPEQIEDGWFVESGGARASLEIELAPATGTQSTNAAAPCYVAPPVVTPPVPPTVITVTNPLAPAPVTYYVTPGTTYLASTGAEPWQLGGLAALVLALGAGLTFIARRRATL